MENRQSNKTTIIISIILIFVTLVFGIIYQVTREKTDTSRSGEYFHDYEINEVQSIIVSLKEVSDKYLTDFVTNVIYFPYDAYNMLEESTKEKYANYDEFLNKLSKVKTSEFLEAQVVSFTNGVIDGKRAIYVIDNANNSYVFIENSINNYVVKVDW